MILGLVGCTLGPGDPFVAFESAVLETGFAPGARALGGGDLVAATGLVWRLDELTAEVGSVDLQSLEGSASFDPADPPPGYSGCHGGHCHADDGSLVDYGVIREQLAGGSATYTSVVGWAPEAYVSIPDGDVVVLGPSDDLPGETTLGRVVVGLQDVHVFGSLGDGTPFHVGLEELSLAAELELAVDRTAPEAVAVALSWVVDGTLLDDVPVDSTDVGPLAARLAAQPLLAELQ